MELKNILATFSGGNSTEEKINQEFSKLAKKLLYGGHFRVMNSKDIYLEEIEFYYHEEGDSSMKDPIMYHTADRTRNKNLPYFEIGRFNMHTSGVDVTFENKDDSYRASFLIRAYSYMDGNKKIIERRSTYIYDDMFFMGIPLDESIEIEWVEDEMDESIKNLTLEGTWRLNVPEYEKDLDGKYIKDEKGNYIKRSATTQKAENIFSYSGNKYVKCHKPWRFIKQY